MKRTMWTLLAVLALTAGGWPAEASAQSTVVPDGPRKTYEPPVVHVNNDLNDLGGIDTDDDSGVAVGEPAPDFKLEDSRGQWLSLADFKGHGAVLVFTDDRKALERLAGIDREVRGLGARLVGVGSESWTAFAGFALDDRIPFVLLSDPTGRIARLYGMYDEDAEAIRPGVVVLDAQGIIRQVWSGSLPETGEVLPLLRQALVAL
jgi:peroxiredoxin